jgi:HAE1 family hydrophobic/amphiphilic exporter-1
MTLSLVAVFIPVLFMGGIIGRLFREFAVVICTAILVSGLVSITLTPMLASRFVRPQAQHATNRWTAWFERAFEATRGGYERTLGWRSASAHRARLVRGQPSC